MGNGHGSLDARGYLAVAELAFFVPALLISIYVVARHGLSKQLGWFYLVMLSVLRLVGASCLLYLELDDDYSESLIITVAITGAIGTAPLLLAMLGFLERINLGMNGNGAPRGFFSLIHIMSIAALIIAIIGGVKESSATVSHTGKHLMEAASILFLTMCLGLTCIAVQNWTRRQFVLSTELKLLHASLVAIPWLLVRMVFSILVSFSSPGSNFYFRNVSVWPKAFMQFLPEAVVVMVFITAGLMTQRIQQAPMSADDIENAKSGQQQRTMGDYRPSRLITNAWHNRDRS